MSFDLQALSRLLAQIPPAAAESLAARINSHPRIFVHGAGRSGLMLKAFAMRLAQAGYTVYVVGEVVTPAIRQGDLLLLASASGKTAGVLHSAQTAKLMGASLFVITATPESPLAACADSCLFIDAPTKDRSDGTGVMGTLFEQAVLLFCDHTVECLGRDVSQMRARHANLE